MKSLVLNRELLILTASIYKLCNNSQLLEGQDSGLGVDLDGVYVEDIGQADDVVLLANSPFKLACLLYLTILYCQR